MLQYTRKIIRDIDATPVGDISLVNKDQTLKARDHDDSSDVDITAKNGTFSGDVSGVNASFSGDVSGNNGSFTGRLTWKSLVLRKGTASPTPGVGGTYGTAVDINPSTNYNGIVPIAISLTAGGSIATGETVTIRITATLSDTTTASVTHDFTTTGTYWLDASEIATFIKDGTYITKFSVDSTSSATSTSATTSAEVNGWQH